jgi:hypothetical protein
MASTRSRTNQRRRRRVSRAGRPRAPLAFLDELARRASRGQPATDIEAGFLLFRAIEGTRTGLQPADWGLPAIGALVNELPEGHPALESLQSIIDDITAGEGNDAIITSLLAYARLLEDQSKWMLAGDVYRTVLRCTARASASTVYCLWRLGRCYLAIGTLARAQRFLRQSAVVAKEIGDKEGYFVALIGCVRIQALRGNLPAALHRTRRIVQRTAQLGLTQAHSRALHELAAIAILQGRPEDAALDAASALTLCRDKHERERIKGDLAAAMILLGLYDGARYIYSGLAKTAVAQVVRHIAICNLLCIAEETGDWPEFRRYEQALDLRDLPPHEGAQVRHALGAGYHRFGRPSLALHHLEAARAIATEHGYNQIRFEVEARMAALKARGEDISDAPAPTHSRFSVSGNGMAGVEQV